MKTESTFWRDVKSIASSLLVIGLLVGAAYYSVFRDEYAKASFCLLLILVNEVIDMRAARRELQAQARELPTLPANTFVSPAFERLKKEVDELEVNVKALKQKLGRD